MKLHVETAVATPWEKVVEQFDHQLLERLTPKGAKLTILHADPLDQVGGHIDLKVKVMGFLSQRWRNRFTELERGPDYWFFVDEGERMPFPIRKWRHKHEVRKRGEGAVIIDHIEFHTFSGLLDRIGKPLIAKQFKGRPAIYQEIFGKPE